MPMAYSLKRMGESQRGRIAMACLLVAGIVLGPLGIDRAIGQEDYKEVDALMREGADDGQGQQIDDRQGKTGRIRYGHSQDAYNRSLAWIAGCVDAGEAGTDDDSGHNARVSFSDGLPAWFVDDVCDPGECEYAGYSDAGGVAGFVRAEDLDTTVSWMLSEMSGKGWQCIAQDRSAGHFEFARQNGSRRDHYAASMIASLSSVHAQINEIGGCTCTVFVTGDSQNT